MGELLLDITVTVKEGLTEEQKAVAEEQLKLANYRYGKGKMFNPNAAAEYLYSEVSSHINTEVGAAAEKPSIANLALISQAVAAREDKMLEESKAGYVAPEPEEEK